MDLNAYYPIFWSNDVLLPMLLFFLALPLIFMLSQALNYLWLTPRRTRRIFESQGIRCLPSSHLLYGNLPDIAALTKEARRLPLPHITNNIAPRILPHYYHWSKTYGNPFVYWNGPPARIILTNPEHAKEVLSTQVHGYGKSRKRPDIQDLIGGGLLGLEGEKWTQHRRIMQPAFFQERLKAMVPTMAACTASMMEKWTEAIERGDHIEVYKEFKDLTADIIAHTAFGCSYAEGKQAFELQHEQQIIVDKLLLTVYLPGSRFIPTNLNRRRWKINAELEKILMAMVKGRLESAAMKKTDDECKGNTYGSDLLGLMMAANQGDLRLEGSNEKNVRMDISEIIGECKTFFFAGHETSSSLLTWASLMLAANPEWQDRAREEVYAVCGRAEMPTPTAIGRLKIMGMVLNETLRLYPPAVAMLRRAVRDTKLAGGDDQRGLVIPEGTEVVIPVIAWQHDAEYWGEGVHEFRPDRWSGGGGDEAARPSGTAFLPFSMGPRVCIGRSFTMLEAKLVMASLVQRFSLRVSPAYRHAPTTVITLQPEFGMPLIMAPLPK